MIDRACISLNHRCNLRCTYCHFAGKENSVNDINYEFQAGEIEIIITNIVEYCKKNSMEKFKLGIVGSGEPLLSFDIISHIVETATGFDKDLFNMYTITNGVQLTNEQLQFFYQNRNTIELNFSLDGNKEIHNTMRQGYEKTMTAIKRYEEKFGEKPRINATVTRKSVKEADKLIEYFIDNQFRKINFSIVSDVNEPSIKITQAEYDDFIDKCAEKGIIMRQKRDDVQGVYDCAKFGRICGVGHNNIFYTRKGIYPCGRFFGLDEYRLASFSAKLDEVEESFKGLKDVRVGTCYYDTYVGGRI